LTQTLALVLTLAIEVPIVVAVVAVARWAPGRLLVVALAAALASLVTHPLLWLIDPLLVSSLSNAVRLALLESLVTIVEAAIYAGPAGLGLRRGLVLSFVANGASLGVGVWIYSAA
jgi:hypothetical protein